MRKWLPNVRKFPGLLVSVDTFSKNVEKCRDGCAKSTVDGSVQALKTGCTKMTQVTPSIHF